jgi:hypothetical protein
MGSFLPDCLPYLTSLYPLLVVVATPSTSQETVDTLAAYQAKVYPEGTKHIGASRRRALELGLEHKGIQHFHYCDFDRLLHWTLHYPDELNGIVTHTIPQSDFLVIGRTPRAFDTHPPAQQETEELTNQVFSFVFGQTMDVTAGSCSASRPAAEQILRLSTASSNATDTEWPLIIHRLTGPELQVDYVEVQGLEFETPTFFGNKTFQRADRAENWLRRVRLCRESVEAAIRVSTASR